MLKKTFCSTMVVCLSVIGTAYAGGEGAGAVNVSPASGASIAPAASPAPADEGLVDKGDLPATGDIPPGVSLGMIHFLRTSEDVEHFEVPEDIPLCSGSDCQKKFQFVLACETADGYTKTLVSPWFRNYATSGLRTRVYEWADPALASCETIDSIDVSWQYGWDDTMPAVPPEETE